MQNHLTEGGLGGRRLVSWAEHIINQESHCLRMLQQKWAFSCGQVTHPTKGGVRKSKRWAVISACLALVKGPSEAIQL